jgi:CBS domain-containing protein
VEQYFLQRGERAVTVTREGDVLLGLVTYADVRRVPRSEWSSRAVGQVMVPKENLFTVSPQDNIEVAIRRMAERHFNQLPVVDEGRLVGMIARVNILRFVELRPSARNGFRR